MSKPQRESLAPTYVGFDKEKFTDRLSRSYDFRGEIGVLSYKLSKRISRIWRFKTPEEARVSSEQIARICLEYLSRAEAQISRDSRVDYPYYNILRADVCRKFLLMGYTRAMRYYYHKGGRKWGVREVRHKEKTVREYFILPRNLDPEKRVSADIFLAKHRKIAESARYLSLRQWAMDHRGEIAFDWSRI